MRDAPVCLGQRAICMFCEVVGWEGRDVTDRKIAAGGRAGQGGADYATKLERASRGLLMVSVTAISQMEREVSPTPLRALQALHRLRTCKVGELAQALDLATSSASRLSDRLAGAGLISRAVAADNRRATQLELTGDGRRIVDELVTVRTATIRHIVQYMAKPDRRALLRGAQAFTEACLTALEHPQPDGPGVTLTKEMCMDPAVDG